jgi:hypothetical protein
MGTIPFEFEQAGAAIGTGTLADLPDNVRPPAERSLHSIHTSRVPVQAAGKTKIISITW